ncbi:hypothetical protein LSA2308_00026 [Staphylococcus phage LSA2308]|nr:hypothetical protein LSA2308_00026 [Staphylococcus phage LSA2308]USZ62983.1 hypothetical protein LSA2311_orf00176 [Staphylococcus phage LSA2311]
MQDLKRITQPELDLLIEKHEQWLATNEKEGEKLFLQCVDLRHADLSCAKLIDSDLTNATLIEADLKRAFLSGINLTNADLRYANLLDVNLSYVDLTGAELSWASTQGIRGLEMYSIDNIGSFKGKVTYLPKYNKVFAGCWEGNLEEFLKKGLEMNEGDNSVPTLY